MLRASIRIVCRVILAGLLLPATAHAEPARQIDWNALIPKLAPFDDPFEKLSQEQYYQLGDIVYVRDLKTRGQPVDAAVAKRARAAEAQLRKEGVDVKGLLARRNEVRFERERRGKAVEASLDGKTVRMPGYVLPLEYTGRKVREFLLVPWVGACIHTPPPPPNQIVHVRIAKGAEFESEGVYTPVWVTGVLHARASKPTLNYADGMADIDTGYSLEASRIEAYKR
jgi:hypothetical protein